MQIVLLTRHHIQKAQTSGINPVLIALREWFPGEKIRAKQEAFEIGEFRYTTDRATREYLAHWKKDRHWNYEIPVITLTPMEGAQL